ncbi:MAG: 4Fe-4S binding protein [Candidatus Omnitrophota bacterium]
MKYPKLRELKQAVKALFKGPYTTRFPYEPHKPYEKFRGRPYFYEKDCVGCASCVQVCPAGAIEVKDIIREDGKAYRKFTVHWDVCIFCGQCQANCITTKGIILSREFDFAVTEKREQLKQEIEKELVVCSCCGEVIVPYDQYLWVAEKLGPLCFSNASLIVFYFNNLNPALKEDKQYLPKQETEFLRSDRIKILCPRCRRQAVLKS